MLSLIPKPDPLSNVLLTMFDFCIRPVDPFRTAPETKRGRQARDVRLFGFHAYQLDDSEGVLHRKAQDERQAYEGETVSETATLARDIRHRPGTIKSRKED